MVRNRRDFLMLSSSTFRLIGTIDGREVALGTYRDMAAARVGSTAYFVTGRASLHPEQAEAWGLGAWWADNRDAFLGLLQTEGALSREARDEADHNELTAARLEGIGFSFILDRMPLLPLIAMEKSSPAGSAQSTQAP
jgi:hypothetical protein